ncbi:hypothetical protein NHQ30_004903 [Ciborinia camelliae]|nr:hypothetical protein NHQ30_004903 [Ciborinia camelliae]
MDDMPADHGFERDCGLWQRAHLDTYSTRHYRSAAIATPQSCRFLIFEGNQVRSLRFVLLAQLVAQ